MDARQLRAMSEALAEVYGAVTDRVIVNLARYFRELKPDEQPGGAFEYQAQKLAELGQVSRETVKIISSMLDGADTAVQRALERAIMDALEPLEPELKKAAEMGLLTPAPDVPADISPRMTRAFEMYYAQSADRLNLVNTVMLESTENAYRATVSDIVSRMRSTQSVLNVAAGRIITGTESFNQAQRLAVEQMVENGITGFVDHGGHRWRPETYVAMDMRSTMSNAARAAFWERNGDYGNDLFAVSEHPGARPKCYPWQRRVISRRDLARDVQDGDGKSVHVHALSETTYGEPDGLFGINCGHFPEAFIPGVTVLQPVSQTPEENAEAYALSQQQRALERKFRQARLELDVARARGMSEDDRKPYADKLTRADAALEEFCEAHNRKRRREREYGR